MMKIYDELSGDPQWVTNRALIHELCDQNPFMYRKLIDLANEYDVLCEQYRKHPLQLTQLEKAEVEKGFEAYLTKKQPAIMLR